VSSALKEGKEVALLYHGRQNGTIVPKLVSPKKEKPSRTVPSLTANSCFGMWEERKDLDFWGKGGRGPSSPDRPAFVEATVLLQFLRGNKAAATLLEDTRNRNVTTLGVLEVIRLCRDTTETQVVLKFVRQSNFTIFEVTERITIKAEDLVFRFLAMRTSGGFNRDHPRPFLPVLEALEIAAAFDNGYPIIVWENYKHRGMGDWPVC
jgi:hypothetical protein